MWSAHTESHHQGRCKDFRFWLFRAQSSYFSVQFRDRGVCSWFKYQWYQVICTKFAFSCMARGWRSCDQILRWRSRLSIQTKPLNSHSATPDMHTPQGCDPVWWANWAPETVMVARKLKQLIRTVGGAWGPPALEFIFFSEISEVSQWSRVPNQPQTQEHNAVWCTTST